ncbi:thrombospondin-2-like [Mercenaria mercenaria]|uniref:thrombospondin-2-like n=1 Tax=Mercenaria mercenaria TaxID=6596 RepID=UPI00234FA6BC|nr:thrombospondin-2-like [Mercenaria mercenaria]XP_053386291.1 thrombospondin-2-like [Mercenaria mercenaria]
MDKLLVVLVLLESFCLTYAIDCYNCTGITNVSDCHHVEFCPNTQYCFIQSNGSGSNRTYTLGCATKSSCGFTTSTSATTVAMPSHRTTSPMSLSTNISAKTTTTELPPQTTESSPQTTESLTQTTDAKTTATNTNTTSTSQGPASLVGRRELLYGENYYIQDDADSNIDCCDTDTCNKHLHESTSKPIVTPTLPDTGCHDKAGFDCDIAMNLFDVCNDIQKAKIVCKKSCNICDLVDGKWSEWGNWSSCDVTCGNGTRERMRTCDDPEPAYGGDNCTGSDMETELCTEQNCPIDGTWANWMSWTDCSVTCGIGLQKRIRNCSNPYPEADGLFCLGTSSDEKICLKTCHDDAWLEWSGWSKCSHSCDFGLMTRVRNCNTTSLFGHSCPGDAHETKLCKDSECPAKFGEWLEWSPWSECSRTCGTGMKTRARECNITSSACYGDLHESDLCVAKECPNPVSAFLVNGVAKEGPENGTIIFSRVITNVGGDYNATTGRFTCRIPGVYSFFVSIEKQLDVNQAYCQLIKNDTPTIYVGSRSSFVNGDHYQQASNSAVLELAADDVIYLGMCSDAKTFTAKSTFSGSLLVAEAGDNKQ